MSVYKDEKNGTWRCIYRYTNWKGERKQTQKRGFRTKREAQAWEREELLKQGAKLDMTFESFYDIYSNNKKARVKESTWEIKGNLVRTKILPYFGQRKIAEITPKDVIAWQNELLKYRDEKGKEKKELEQKIAGKRQELKKSQETLSEIPKMQGYENALEVKKAYKAAVTELEGVRKLQSEWDQKGIPEKKYWVIKANVPEQTKQKSIHERLEEKKRDVEQKQKKERKRSHGRDCL